MHYDIEDLAVREDHSADTAEIAELLAQAMGDGLVARWLMPDLAVRRKYAPAYFEIFAEHALRYGTVHRSVDEETGELTGIALWLVFTAPIPAPADYDQRMKEVAGSAFDRVRELDAALEANHPMEPHHYLALLAVRPDLQCRGIGSALLAHHHAAADAAGLPSYLEANHPRNRDLYLRHGYRVRSEIELPDSGPSIWPMWREPLA
jgi:GNAT superfamily N-acetyltransferase